jgi:hypothetical protein
MSTTKEQRSKWALCGAKKRNGETCRNYAGTGTNHLGIGACKYHLGNAKNHQKAAIKVLVEREHQAAIEEARKFGQVIEMDPLSALLWSLHLSASHTEYLRQEIGRAGDSAEQVFRREVLLRQWNDERDRLARTSKMALDAGVDERRIKMAERFGEAIATLIQGVLDDLALNKRQRAEVPEVVRRHLLVLDGEAVEQAALPAAHGRAR